MSEKRYGIHEITEELGMPHEFVVECVRAHWIIPASPTESSFDEEDFARLGLIHELMHDFGANRESIAVILHLVDQIHYLRAHQNATVVETG